MYKWQTIVHADTVEATTAETAKPAEEKKDTVEDNKAVYEVAVEKQKQLLQLKGNSSRKTEETTAAAERKKKQQPLRSKQKKNNCCSRKERRNSVAEENKPRTRSRRAVAED